jgi:hypothetical protein
METDFAEDELWDEHVRAQLRVRRTLADFSFKIPSLLVHTPMLHQPGPIRLTELSQATRSPLFTLPPTGWKRQSTTLRRFGRVSLENQLLSKNQLLL